MPDIDELNDYLRHSQLCALPQSASRMIELSKDPANGPREYAEPISADLGLSCQILRFVNSSFFGFRYKITSIPMALSMVSVRTIRNFVLWNGLFSVLPNPHCGPFSLKKLFQDALRRAVFARIVTEQFTSFDSDEAFICALMQDIAIPILAAKWANEYTQMIQKSNTEQVRLSVLERDMMGWNHSDAGVILATSWNLGELIGHAVSKHTDYVFTGDIDKKLTISDITALSALLPKVTDQLWFEVVPFVVSYRRMFGPKLTEITAILRKTDIDCGRLTGLISLGNHPMSLYEYWQETLNTLPWTESNEIIATEEQLENFFVQESL